MSQKEFPVEFKDAFDRAVAGKWDDQEKEVIDVLDGTKPRGSSHERDYLLKEVATKAADWIADEKVRAFIKQRPFVSRVFRRLVKNPLRRLDAALSSMLYKVFPGIVLWFFQEPLEPGAIVSVPSAFGLPVTGDYADDIQPPVQGTDPVESEINRLEESEDVHWHNPWMDDELKQPTAPIPKKSRKPKAKGKKKSARRKKK